MKRFKWIYGLSLMVLFASCSNDDFVDEINESTTETEKFNPNGALVKKVIATSDGGVTVTTDNYVYSGSKLSKVNSSDGRSVVYSYGGNLITERTYYVNNVLNTKEVYEYNSNNQLIGFKRYNPSNAVIYQTVYTFNSDGTISAKGYRGSSISQSNLISDRKVFVTGGQVSKIETYTVVNGSPVTETLTYSFDNKISPFKNIIGFDKLTYYDTALNGSARNVTQISSGSNHTDVVSYTYNSSNYPVTATRGMFTFQYTY